MGVNRMTGSPWHAERVYRAEGDDRRYKGRCEFYRYEDEWCTYRSGRCMGSAHCQKYKAISEEDFKKKQRRAASTTVSKKKKDDEPYWFD